jgi:DNA-binding NtrC family response regulator
LRKRPEDLSLSVHYFPDEAARALNKPEPVVPQARYQWLRGYACPGHVRELKAVVSNVVTCHQGRRLSLQSFKGAIAANARLATSAMPPEAAPARRLFPDPLPTLCEVEAALVAAVLRRAAGHQGVAADRTDLSRHILHQRLTPSQSSRLLETKAGEKVSRGVRRRLHPDECVASCSSPASQAVLPDPAPHPVNIWR